MSLTAAAVKRRTFTLFATFILILPALPRTLRSASLKILSSRSRTRWS